MPTATRTPRRSPVQGRRAPVQGRYARAAAHRGQGLRRRKPSEPTGLKKMLSAVLPAAAAKKAAPSSKKGKAGGLALAAAAAGVAFKYRDKLARKSGQGSVSPPPSTPAV
jgi:hypothetical protein